MSQEIQEVQNTMTADELAASMRQGLGIDQNQDPNPVVTPLVEGVEDSAIFNALREVGGVEIENRESLQSIFQQASQVSTLQQQINQLEAEKAKAGVPQHVGDLDKAFTDYLNAGMSTSEALDMLRIRTMDVANMSNREKLIMAMKLETPGLGQDQIELLVDKKLKSLEDEDGNIDPYKEAELAREMIQVTKGLEERKLASPDIQSKNQATREANQQLETGWSGYGNQIYGSLAVKKDYAINDETKVDFDFALPADSQEEIVNSASQIMAEQGLALNKENAEKFHNLVHGLTFMKHGFEIMDAYAKKVNEAYAASLSGVPPKPPIIPNPTGNPTGNPTDLKGMLRKGLGLDK